MGDNQDLNYYLERSNFYHVNIRKSSDENEYFCHCNEIGEGTCFGLGQTPKEALDDFYENLADYIEVLYKNGTEIPKPLNILNEYIFETGTIRFIGLKKNGSWHIFRYVTGTGDKEVLTIDENFTKKELNSICWSYMIGLNEGVDIGRAELKSEINNLLKED